MFSSVFGILCGVFIAADYFGYHTLNGFAYFGCCYGLIVGVRGVRGILESRLGQRRS